MGAPEIDTRLGWFCPNICASEIRRSVQFYEMLGFQLFGGKLADKWATMRFGSTELHLFEGYITENLLHWRGGWVEAIAGLAEAGGIEAETAFEQHADGAETLTLRDIQGNGIFFNTFPSERGNFLAGAPFSIPDMPDWQGSSADRFSWVLASQAPLKLASWYGKLGLEHRAGAEPGTLELVQGSTLIPLDSGLTRNRIIVSYRRPGALQDTLLRLQERGVDIDSGVLHDPDGNEILLSDQ